MEKEEALIEKTEDINITTLENKTHSLLNKIRHKPIIMESIYSFSQNRPYMLFHLISNDAQLKSSLKNIFDNAKKANTLSKELNENIETYITFRKLKERIEEKFSKLKSEISKFNEKINRVIQKPINELSKDEIEYSKEFEYIQYYLERFYDRDTFISNFIDKKYISKRNKILELYYLSYRKSENKYIYFKDKYSSYNMIPIKQKEFFNMKIDEELKNQVNIQKIIWAQYIHNYLYFISLRMYIH